MRWTIRLAKAAENDFAEVVDWTARRFGERQAAAYARVLVEAVVALEAGPRQPGVTARDDIRKGILTLHVARKGRQGRHFIVFRVGDAKARRIDVVRNVHHAMDLPRHLPS